LIVNNKNVFLGNVRSLRPGRYNIRLETNTVISYRLLLFYDLDA
jgi:hypothetical protein